LEKYYRLCQLEKYMTTGFVEQFHQDHDVKNILAGWWVEDKRFFANNAGLYIDKSKRSLYLCHGFDV
jgi:hypothetical protein